MTVDYVDLFHASFACVTKSYHFFEDFHAAFVASSEEVAAKYRGTDAAFDGEMVAMALTHMVAFFGSGKPSEELQRLASVHGKSHRNIEWGLYDNWLEALVATVREHDRKWNGSVEVAWRIVFAPGIAYMKSHYDSGVIPGAI